MPLDIIEGFQRGGAGIENTKRASQLRSFYEMLSVYLFQQYEPTKKVSERVSRDFMVRLNDWLECFDDDKDRWTAFRSLEYFFFAGQHEFEELYRVALENILVPWLVDYADIDIFSANAEEQLDDELRAVWPCPVTDSLKINSFLHITGLEGQGIRPDWYSLRLLACKEKIENYRSRNSIKYLLLLEDFSGSGMQLVRALKFAYENFSGPIIVVPLVICAPGDRAVKDTITKLGATSIYYKPATVISDQCLVSQEAKEGQPNLFESLRSTLKVGYELIDEPIDGEEYGWEGVGSLVALYSNCPNNTPPIYHHTNSNWTSIFPRSIREVKR